MSVESGQQYHLNVPHVLRKAFTFANADQTISMGWLPAGAVVYDAFIVVDTAFNSGTSDVGDVGFRNAGDGTADDPDEWLSAGNLTAAGIIAADEIDASVADLYFPKGAEAVVVYTSTGTAPTAGSGWAHVLYTVDNT